MGRLTRPNTAPIPVHKIEVFPTTFNIHFLVDKTAMLTIDWESEGSGVPEAKKNLVTGSKTLTNGGSARGRTVDLYHVKVAL